MRYQFGDYTLDSVSLLLCRNGEVVDVARRVFDCLSYLLEQRRRAVGRDDLIHKLWGRANVSDNQLAQVVASARRLLGDDGASQRLIRTVPGYGYHWVGAVVEVDEIRDPARETPFKTSPPEPVAAAMAVDSPYWPAQRVSTISSIESTAPAVAPVGTKAPAFSSVDAFANMAAASATLAVRRRSGISRKAAWLAPAFLVIAILGWQLRSPPPASNSPSLAEIAPVDPLARLQDALRKGQFEQVREGLAQLPAALADSVDAGILDIDLDRYRGFYKRALEKLARQQAKALAAKDSVWQARLLLLKSDLIYRGSESDSEVLELAQSAVKLLEAQGSVVPPQVLAQAYAARGRGLVLAGQRDAAVRDQIHSRELYLSIADHLGALNASSSLARVWVRRGRLIEALEQLTANMRDYARFEDPVNEIFARVTALRIQVELLRWKEALANSDRAMQLLKVASGTDRRQRVLTLRALVLSGLGRLREAESLLEEAASRADENERDLIIPAIWSLESGQLEQALKYAGDAFATSDATHRSQGFLEDREGALLIWVIAAQSLAAEGKTTPEPTAKQLLSFQQPGSLLERIARARWLWMQGQSQPAEQELRLALAQENSNLRSKLLASEALVDLLLQRGETDAAAQVLAELWAHAPETLEQDYHSNLLGLRVALAQGELPAIRIAMHRSTALAGERALPQDVVMALNALGDDAGAAHAESRK